MASILTKYRFALFHILNEVNNQYTADFNMLQEWDDTRLQWFDTSLTTKDYTAVLFLFASEEYIWRPAILIENA